MRMRMGWEWMLTWSCCEGGEWKLIWCMDRCIIIIKCWIRCSGNDLWRWRRWDCCCRRRRRRRRCRRDGERRRIWWVEENIFLIYICRECFGSDCVMVWWWWGCEGVWGVVDLGADSWRRTVIVYIVREFWVGIFWVWVYWMLLIIYLWWNNSEWKYWLWWVWCELRWRFLSWVNRRACGEISVRRARRVIWIMNVYWKGKLLLCVCWWGKNLSCLI